MSRKSEAKGFLSPDDLKKLNKLWGKTGIDQPAPHTRPVYQSPTRGVSRNPDAARETVNREGQIVPDGITMQNTMDDFDAGRIDEEEVERRIKLYKWTRPTENAG